MASKDSHGTPTCSIFIVERITKRSPKTGAAFYAGNVIIKGHAGIKNIIVAAKLGEVASQAPSDSFALVTHVTTTPNGVRTTNQSKVRQYKISNLDISIRGGDFRRTAVWMLT